MQTHPTQLPCWKLGNRQTWKFPHAHSSAGSSRNCTIHHPLTKYYTLFFFFGTPPPLGQYPLCPLDTSILRPSLSSQISTFVSPLSSSVTSRHLSSRSSNRSLSHTKKKELIRNNPTYTPIPLLPPQPNQNLSNLFTLFP
jgi:hypothetical protein